MAGVTPAVWDAVLFNDERALLDVRAGLLDGVVDHLVVVEGTRTFNGEPKPLHFAATHGALGFSGEVHCVAVDLPEIAETAWAREHRQRAAIEGYLRAHAAPDDLLLIGDVDELPRRDVVERLATTLERPARLEMVDALYFANWVQPRPWMIGTMATRLDGFDHPSVRELLGTPPDEDDEFVEEVVADAGWHVSFMGGPSAIARKLHAYSHQELNTSVNRRAPFLEGCLRYGTHFAGWVPLHKLRHDELPAHMQQLAVDHPELFAFDDPPRRAASLTWCAWAWVRPHAPPTLSAWMDKHPRALFATLGAGLLPLQLARQVRRRQEGVLRRPAGKEFVPSPA